MGEKGRNFAFHKTTKPQNNKKTTIMKKFNTILAILAGGICKKILVKYGTVRDLARNLHNY